MADHTTHPRKNQTLLSGLDPEIRAIVPVYVRQSVEQEDLFVRVHPISRKKYTISVTKCARAHYHYEVRNDLISSDNP